MPTYLQRYQQGECKQVWTELIALGEQVRQEPLLSDALAVARETMSRVRVNAETIALRLQSSGYHFGYEADEDEEEDSLTPPYHPPSPNAAKQVAALEELVGPLPLSLRAWYEIGGSVDFIGFHQLWPDIYTDPLVISPIEYAFDEFKNWQFWVAEHGREEAGPFCIPIAPDYYHKDNVSGGEPYQIRMPCVTADAKLFNEWHDTNFVEYLRECFRWGGFPGFDIQHPMNPNHLNADAVMPPEHLALLTAGLLPI